jgi:DNA-binding MarR family transcriptional regulator
MHTILEGIRYVKVYRCGVATRTSQTQLDRPDLAAMISRLRRRLLATEQPILAAHGVSMWGYIVLTTLDKTPLRTQIALARAIGADKTRIIAVLDDLHEQGLIGREPDPADRRMRLLTLTPAGRRLRTIIRRAIRREEERLLSQFPATERRIFLRILQTLQESADDYEAD